MATLSRAEGKNMYSWWWDSHISPKNSKWLQENLTDMDSKVKVMIKLIEVDEDSFARRAEMYYKKRPELMKLVEEFYRAYRALAERYDHATGVIRQAHRTMAEAFPNQVPFSMTDDGIGNETHDSRPCTPEMQTPTRAAFDPDELLGGEVGLSSNGDFTNDSRSLVGGKGFTQVNKLGKVKKGLNFNGFEKKSDDVRKNDKKISESDRLGKSETDIQALKEALVKLEAEKQAGLLEYQQTLERLSKLESEVSMAKEDSEGFSERASKAEEEVESLKETLSEVEAEREDNLLKYQQCLNRISNLEGHISCAEKEAGQLNERACKAEEETELLKEEVNQIKTEKEVLLGKYMEALEKIANIENKLLMAEDFASRTSDRADRAEKEVGILMETIARLTEEKDAAVIKYEQCLEKITALEREIALIQEETERLKTEVRDGVAKWKDSEEQCVMLEKSNKAMQFEVESLVEKVGMQNEELSEKQKEMGRLWTCVQEEHMRFKDAETSFQSLQKLHSKVQEELRSVATELERKVQHLKDVEIQNQCLEDEVEKVKNDNRSMHEEIVNLQEGKRKLEQEVGNLEKTRQKNDGEIADLVQKLGVMEKLTEKNKLLENSLSVLRVELEGAREKVEALEESRELLMGEKSVLGVEKTTLITQLQMTTENLEKLSERNTLLENSLFDANAELETLRAKSKSLEESCRLLTGQNSVLVTEKLTLAAQLETTLEKLEDLGTRHVNLELRYSGLEKEREVTLQKVEELRVHLDVEKQEHAKYSKSSRSQIANLENQIRVLQEVGDHMKEEFEEQLDKAVNAQFDIFILQKGIQDLKDKNSSLLKYCEKLVAVSQLSEKLISELEHTSLEQQEEVKVLTGQTKGLRSGMSQLLEALEAGVGPSCDGYSDEDQRTLEHILEKLDILKTSLYEAWDENQELLVEKSVLVSVLSQLKNEVSDLNVVAFLLRQEIGNRNEQLCVMQNEMQNLLESNEDLILKVREGNQKEVILLTEMENLREKMFNLQQAYGDLQEENYKVIEEKESLMHAYGNLEEENHTLEHEYSCMIGKAVTSENLSFVFKNIMCEKAMQVKELTENVDKLCNNNGLLVEKLRSIEGKMEEALTENMNLEVVLKKSENEMEQVNDMNDQLKKEIANVRELLCLKEKDLCELSENHTQKFKECENLCEFVNHLDGLLSKVQKEYEETEARTVALSSELQKGKEEVKLWETIAGTFFTELQSSSVREALIKEKYFELIKAYENLEEESYAKGMDIAHLRERIGVLEGENSDTKAQLAANHSAILALRDSVASLEKHTTWITKLQSNEDEDKKGAKHFQNLRKHEKVAATQMSGDLQEVQARIQAVQSAIIELKQHANDEYSTLRFDLDSAMKQIETLKSQSGSRRGRLSRRSSSLREGGSRNVSIDGLAPQKTYPNVSQPAQELLMKDIVLDQASDCSSYGKNRKAMESDEQILELWETVDQGGSIDLTVGKSYNKYGQLEAVKENKSGRPSSVSMVDKELCVDDQQEISKRFLNPEMSKRCLNPEKDDQKRKTLERLASDVQKLTNLQITVQDLKEKLMMSTTDTCSSKGECDGINDQLVETEETISKLFDYSGKLMKKIENSSSNSSSFDGSVGGDSSGGENARRRRRSEQASRISERIGRLQLEVQKIQFFLMKLDNNNSNKGGKGGGRIMERSARVLLRDYLYGGGTRTPRRRKKAHFCGCVQPPTQGD